MFLFLELAGNFFVDCFGSSSSIAFLSGVPAWHAASSGDLAVIDSDTCFFILLLHLEIREFLAQ